MILGISGYARAGKNTIADILTDLYGFSQLSFAGPLKEAVYRLNPLVQGNQRVQDIIDQFGWDQAKDSFPEVRKLLQRMGTEVGRDLFSDSFWIDMADKAVQNTVGSIVFTDVRYENEALFITENNWDGEGYIIRVTRPGIGPVNAHASDTGIRDDLVDFTINNNGSLEDLKNKVKELFTELW